jgi:hypothetical protein
MRRWLARLLVADDRLKARIAELESELDAARRQLEVTAAERDALAGVVARDRARIEMETARFARRRAEDEHAVNGKLS